jgi:MFS family permease
MDTMHIERHRDRQAMARDAGLGSLSGVSVLAGTLAAYGLTAALLAIAGGMATLIHGGSDFGGVSSGNLKVTAAIVIAGVLFLSYLFGGYVAGRMARRRGITNGLGVFVLGVILAVGIAIWVKEAGGGPSLASTLRDVGAPTTWHAWRAVGTIAGAISLVAMWVGSMIGGAHGERWHTKLVRRALDPSVGPPVERQPAPPVVETPVAGEDDDEEEEEDSEDRSTWRHLLHH